MGIQGLLPLLKPIQRQRHLSELAGQTLAVDAYVWLHRGAYACAAELVQGRPTRRYVDYCMARVRLLRHHRVEPYLVFDGGPLPAKLGTEKEREKRREENARRAKELLAQGRASQAAEYFTKCVDVTPQMAYQVIKALKAENVQYVVAPYEADAQLAYLERTGLVDGILTEDSDLLVFGCRIVHVKLDAVSATVVSISRVDFGSPALARDSFSLVGWSEAQFRWMAMLSGCDYLPSIAGVGLKTAYHLLKKYKVVDKAVKMIRLEGKKTVPKGYLDSFYLAEKVFLHQRVYDPRLKKLVYLTSPPESLCLSDEVEMYIGRDMEPSLASRIAEGMACPITFSDMEDINPSFVPKPARAGPLQRRDINRVRTTSGKPPCKRGSLLDFLTPIPKTHQLPPSKTTSPIKPGGARQRMQIGNSSGKRTLIDVMEHDMETKRKRIAQDCGARPRCDAHRNRGLPSTSHFFSSPKSNCAARDEVKSVKENTPPPTVSRHLEQHDPVTQEDGYLSPSPSLSRAGTPDISSPIVSCKKILPHKSEAICASPLDSPESSLEDAERVLVRASSEPIPDEREGLVPGPDLAPNLETDDGDDEADGRSDATSEIFFWDEDFNGGAGDETVCTSRESLLLSTKRAQGESFVHSNLRRARSFDDPTDELELLEIDEEMSTDKERNSIQTRLAQKWRQTYSFGACRVPRKASNEDDLKASHKGGIVKRTPLSRESSGSGAKRRVLPASVDTCLRQSRKSPIVISADDTSPEITYDSKARLREFRFVA